MMSTIDRMNYTAGDEVREGHRHPFERLADGPGSLESLGGHLSRLDLSADLGVDPTPPPRPHPVGEADDQPGTEEQHDDRQEVVLEPVLVDVEKLPSTAL